MAGRRLSITSGAIASSTSTNTLVGVTAPTSQWLELVEATISWAGVTAAHVPVQCQVIKWATLGTGAGTAVTPVQILSEATDAVRSSSLKDFSSEPSGTITVIDEKLVSPNNGLWVWNFAAIGFVQLKAGEGAGVRVITPANDNTVTATMLFVE